MPKFNVDFTETYYATRSYQVEAETEEEAINIAMELQQNADETPRDEIHLNEWEFEDIYKA